MFVVLRSTSGHEPPRLPNRDAISRGEEHHLDLRIVNHDGTWLVDTDLLAILIDRLGTLAEVVLPISDQM
jgi:hypothetical protein